MELDGIEVFVKVVQAGSFSQAARLLGMPKTTVSAKVAKIERRLGVTLIQRTTRKLNVTPAGQAYFQRCARALEEVAAGEAELVTSNKDPQGLLRITVVVDFAHSLLSSMVRQYLKKFPKMQIELIVTNREVDLVAEGVDLAIRAGVLDDSSMVARKLMTSHIGLWASPSYLKRNGSPARPSDLADHDCLLFSMRPDEPLTLMNGKEEAEVRTNARLTADDFETLKTFILSGDGIGPLPDYLAEREVHAGRLVKVLPKWILDSSAMSFVYPAQRFLSPKVQSFIALALEGTK